MAQVKIGNILQPFSCINDKYQTNVNEGQPHSPSPIRGSVNGRPLINYPGCSLWLEHVISTDKKEKVYWLMWYDSQGVPLLSGSSVFDEKIIPEMIDQLNKIKIPE